MRTRTLTQDQTLSFQNALERAVRAESFGAKSVSASFGKQIARNAIFAILVSLLLITIYVSFRFQWKFAVPVLVALAHDVAIAVGIYALSGREVSTATVAAILTVLGYSIYDTIIIFDRIRENIPLMRRSSFRTLTNVSLWETIPRSLATTFITLLPIVSLLTFGGETLKDFAFALLVGIVSGAYSSIFVAAPVVAVLKEREPEYRKRQDDAGALEGLQSVGGAALAADCAARAGCGSCSSSPRGSGAGGVLRCGVEARAPQAAPLVAPARPRALGVTGRLEGDAVRAERAFVGRPERQRLLEQEHEAEPFDGGELRTGVAVDGQRGDRDGFRAVCEQVGAGSLDGGSGADHVVDDRDAAAADDLV